MVSIKSVVWDTGLAVLFGGVILFAVYKLGQSAGSGTPAENWSTLASAEFTGNVSLIGLVLVIGLIGAVIGYVKFVRR